MRYRKLVGIMIRCCVWLVLLGDTHKRLLFLTRGFQWRLAWTMRMMVNSWVLEVTSRHVINTWLHPKSLVVPKLVLSMWVGIWPWEETRVRHLLMILVFVALLLTLSTSTFGSWVLSLIVRAMVLHAGVMLWHSWHVILLIGSMTKIKLTETRSKHSHTR